MKFGLHAYSLTYAMGLREYQPVKHGILTVEELLSKAAAMKFNAVQLARRNIPDWDMVTLVRLRVRAEALKLELHLSTNILGGEHLADMIRAADSLGAKQVTAGLSYLQGNMKERQSRLEKLLLDLDIAIKTAERYKITLAIENGRHTAAVDLAAFIQAAQSEYFGACFDTGNALSVPENPQESAEILAKICKSIHLKDFKVFRTRKGIMLVNCPLGDGVINIIGVLREFKDRLPHIPVFIQTEAEHLPVPLLEEEFLRRYPRINARCLAAAIRQGTFNYQESELRFPHETNALESDVLQWEEDRLKRSLKQAKLLIGQGTLPLSLD